MLSTNLKPPFGYFTAFYLGKFLRKNTCVESTKTFLDFKKFSFASLRIIKGYLRLADTIPIGPPGSSGSVV